MITKIWNICGRIAFWLSWPLLAMYLNDSSRTRILVTCGEEVLLVRSWLGNGQWGLPGGGMHRSEQPEQGAIRELHEETGIHAQTQDLKFLFAKDSTYDKGPNFKVYAYHLVLPTKPKLTKQKFEISHLMWMNIAELSMNANTDEEVRSLIEASHLA